MNSKGTGLNNNCRKARKTGSCKYSTNLDKLKDWQEDYAMIDVEELVEKGKKEALCPFYLSRKKLPFADIVFVPYNYIFDEVIAEVMDFNLKDNILIVDEGHNLESTCEEGNSLLITTSKMSQIFTDLEMYRLSSNKEANKNGKVKRVEEDKIEDLKNIFSNITVFLLRYDLKEMISNNNKGFNDFVGRKIIPKELFDIFFEGSKKADQQKLAFGKAFEGLTPENFEMYIDILVSIEAELNEVNSQSLVLGEGIRLFKLVQKLYVNYKDCKDKNELQTDRNIFNSYKCVIQESEVENNKSNVKKNNKKSIGSNKERVLHILCLNPGLRLNEVLKKPECEPLSFILTSGMF